jgi:hypothetical protein
MKHTNRTYRSRRTRQLARVHLLAKHLNLTEAAYHNMLNALTGHRTAATLDETGRPRVIGFLAGEIARKNSQPGPTTPAPVAILPRETVTDEEALEILGMAA